MTARMCAYTAESSAELDGSFACGVIVPCFDGEAPFDLAVRGYPPARFPSHVLFIPSYQERPTGHAAEATTTTTTR